MSYSFFAHQDLNFPVAGAVVANVPADDATPSWERLTGEIQRLFKVAIAAASMIPPKKSRDRPTKDSGAASASRDGRDTTTCE